MDLPQPSELARALGFRADGKASDIASSPKAVEAVLRSDLMFSPSQSIPYDTKCSFMAEFTSQYLPSAIQTLSDTRLYPNHFIPIAQAVTGYEGHSFPRFARTFPRDAIGIYVSFATALQLVYEKTEFLMHKHPTGRSLIILNLEAFLNIAIILTAHLPLGTSLPPLPSAIKETLRGFAALCEQKSELGAAWIERFGEGGVLVDALRLLASGETDSRRVREAFGRRPSSVIWWECEHPHERGTKHEGTCTYPKDAEEMMACGRCRGVRYCSNAHQKADWKRHKRFCFEPNW